MIPKQKEKTSSLILTAAKEPNKAPNITGKAYGKTSLILNRPCLRNKAEPKASCNSTPTRLTAFAPCDGSPIARYKAILTIVPPAESVLINPTRIPDSISMMINETVKLIVFLYCWLSEKFVSLFFLFCFHCHLNLFKFLFSFF